MAKSKSKTDRGSTQEADFSAHDTLHDESPPFERQTLPTGAAFKATWKMPAFRPSGSPPSMPAPDASNVSGVRRLAESEHPPSAAGMPSKAQTLISMVPGAAMPSQPPGKSDPALHQTLRMEMGVAVRSEPPPRHSVFQQNEPRDTLEPAAPTHAQSATRKAALSGSQDSVRAASVQRVGESASAGDTESTRPSRARATDPFGHPAQREAQPIPRNPVPDLDHAAITFPPPDGRNASFAESVRAGASRARSAAPDVANMRTASGRVKPLASASKGPLSARALLGAGLCIGALVAALALLFFATEPGTSADSERSAVHVVTPAPVTTAQAAARAGAAVTELTSQPLGAEVVLAGAVVANTPAKIARQSYEVDYLVRKPGFDAQLIRIGPKSPAQISVTLLPVVAEKTK